MDLVALLVLSSLAILGLVTPTEALGGFANPAVVTVWAMFIISEGLTRTGIADKIGTNVARDAGSTGTTIISSALGVCLNKTIGIFGLELLNPRDVILVLVEKRRAAHVLDELLRVGDLDQKLDTGIAIMLDVEKALGLAEQIKKLEVQKPLDA